MMSSAANTFASTRTVIVPELIFLGRHLFRAFAEFLPITRSCRDTARRVPTGCKSISVILHTIHTPHTTIKTYNNYTPPRYLWHTALLDATIGKKLLQFYECLGVQFVSRSKSPPPNPLPARWEGRRAQRGGERDKDPFSPSPRLRGRGVGGEGKSITASRYLIGSRKRVRGLCSIIALKEKPNRMFRQRAGEPPQPMQGALLDIGDIFALQQTIGNQATMRLLRKKQANAALVQRRYVGDLIDYETMSERKDQGTNPHRADEDQRQH